MPTHVFTMVYVAISVLVILADFFTVHKCMMLKRTSAKWLAVTCTGAASVQGAYLLSVFEHNYFLASVYSSLYFISVSVTVFALFTFFRIFLRSDFGKREIVSFYILVGILALDIIMFTINPFKEIIVNYVRNDSEVAAYSFVGKPLFWGHLAWIYVAMTVVFVNLYKGALRVPKIYRRIFAHCIVILVAVVAINGFYIFFPSAFGDKALDYSIWGYTLAALMVYQNCYVYSVTGMKPYYHLWIVENVNQGVALFDYADRLTITNKMLSKMMPELKFKEEMSIDDFLEQINVELKPNRKLEDYSIQFYVNDAGKNHSIRLDHRCLISERGEIIGRLLVFTDEVGDVDVLTSFYNWEIFKANQNGFIDTKDAPIVVAVCDINGLGDINNEYGRSTGDRAISILADSIRKNFPIDTHFVRGQEASLIAITSELNADEVREIIAKIQSEMNQQEDIPCFINIQSAVEVKASNDQDVLDVIKTAFKSMQNKKLLDTRSHKSELVRSLIKALEEVDTTTEEHVKRTQTMGYELGKRIGLTDVQLSDLALLCILHDIGKVGIPLNILNKPSKLSDSEWRVMKSHTEKGYQIAMSANELSDIADMILHHHECWDGRGYPDGLSKESIPLLSRIISVVDAYDAMVNDRPYRKGMTTTQAINELKRCAGKQFDPVIVSEFIAMLPEVNTEDVKEETIIMSAQVIDIANFDKSEADVSNVHTVDYCRYLLDNSQHVVDYDETFEKLTGYTKEDIEELKLTQNDLLPEEDRVGYSMMVNEQIAKHAMAYFEHRIKCKDGHIKRVLCSGKLYFDSAAGENRSEIIVVDSTTTHAMKAILDEEHTKAQARLERWEDKYRTDSLTGILNHEAFRSEVEMRLINGTNKVMFMMMDVDKFKNYNDTKGHKAGDEFLIMISQNLVSALRSDDLACRMGGDEFACALVYPPTTPNETIIKRAKQIYEKLNYILMTDNSGTSLSAGVVISNAEYNTFNKLYEVSDRALYDAKENGRSHLVVAE